MTAIPYRKSSPIAAPAMIDEFELERENAGPLYQVTLRAAF